MCSPLHAGRYCPAQGGDSVKFPVEPSDAAFVVTDGQILWESDDLGGVPPKNPFDHQWIKLDVVSMSRTSISAGLSMLNGSTPVAVRCVQRRSDQSAPIPIPRCFNRGANGRCMQVRMERGQLL